jgi:hypothetical protein
MNAAKAVSLCHRGTIYTETHQEKNIYGGRFCCPEECSEIRGIKNSDLGDPWASAAWPRQKLRARVCAASVFDFANTNDIIDAPGGGLKGQIS